MNNSLEWVTENNIVCPRCGAVVVSHKEASVKCDHIIALHLDPAGDDSTWIEFKPEFFSRYRRNLIEFLRTENGEDSELNEIMLDSMNWSEFLLIEKVLEDSTSLQEQILRYVQSDSYYPLVVTIVVQCH